MKPFASMASIVFLLAVSSVLSQVPQPVAGAKPGFTLADLKAQIPQDKDGVFLMEVSEILNTVTDPAVRGLLQGQRVITTAQMVEDPGAKEGVRKFRLIRSQVQCCASHLRQCSVAAEFAGKIPRIRNRTWVRVTGVLDYRQEGGQVVCCVVVKDLKEIPPPENQLLR